MNFSIETIIISLSVILVSTVCHEFMHGLVAYWLGDNTAKDHGRLSFNPIKHIDPILSVMLPLICVIIGGPIIGGAKPVPFNPKNLKYREWGSALVAVAGPLTNLILAFLCMIIAIKFGFRDIFVLAATINLSFFAFNLLPIPPLDGSRVLYAVAPEPVQKVMVGIEKYGLLVVFAIILLFNQIIYVFISNIVQFFWKLFIQILT